MAAQLVQFVGFAVMTVTDFIMIYRMFAGRGFLWGLFAISPFGWVLGPFMVGLGLYFVIGGVIFAIGAAMEES